MRSFWVGFLGLFSIGIIDAVTKWAFHIYQPIFFGYSPVLEFYLYQNKGVAFDLPVPFFLSGSIAIITIIGLFLYLKTQKEASVMVKLSAWSIIFGALGNFFDRLITHHTTDWLILFSQSAINLSDILIVGGVISLLWYTKNT